MTNKLCCCWICDQTHGFILYQHARRGFLGGIATGWRQARRWGAGPKTQARADTELLTEQTQSYYAPFREHKSYSSLKPYGPGARWHISAVKGRVTEGTTPRRSKRPDRPLDRCHSSEPTQRAPTKWHELICDHCLGAGTFNNGSTCQSPALLPNKVTNSPLTVLSCAWHKAPIVTSHSHSNNFSSKWHCTTTGHCKGAEKKDFASVLSCRHQGGGGSKTPLIAGKW